MSAGTPNPAWNSTPRLAARLAAAAVACVTCLAMAHQPASTGGAPGAPGNAPTPARNPDAAPDRPAQIPATRFIPDAEPTWSQVGEELPYAPASSIAAYVDLLDVDDYTARQNAAEFIYSTPAVALPTIEPYLLDRSLSPETRSRLDAIGNILFSVTPRGAMGVQFERQGVAPIIIRNTLRDNPFFRAHEVLMPGDEVLKADGERVSTYDEFQGAILSHDPYETIRLQLNRQGQTIELDVPLGDYMRLGNGTLPPEHVLRMAWDRRLTRLRATAGEPMTPTLDCRPADQRPIPADAPRDGDKWDRIRPSALVAGGLSRGAVDQDGNALEANPLEMDATTIDVRDYVRQGRLAEAEMRALELRAEEMRARHERLIEIRQRHRDEIAQVRLQLDDPTLRPDLRTALTDRLARLESSLGQTQMLIDQINMLLPLGR